MFLYVSVEDQIDFLIFFVLTFQQLSSQTETNICVFQLKYTCI